MVPSCSFWSKVSSSGLVSSYSVPQQMPYRRRPPAPHYPRSSPRCIRLALLGLTCEAPPVPSSVAMDLKAQGLRRSPAAPTARLKPRRLMRSAADLDAGVEVEPGQRRLTGGRKARFPAVEESQADPVGRTPRPGRRQPRTAHQRLRNAVLGAVCTGISGRLDPSGHDCLPQSLPRTIFSSIKRGHDFV